MERRAKVNAVKELAVRSGQMISMDPERWGEHMLDSLEIGLQKFLDRLPEEVRDEYEDRYIEKYKEWLYAQSRCFSQMITGAGGWNAATIRRHEKTNAAEHAAYERLQNWVEKVVKRCNRQERLTGWAEVERLQEKIDTLKESQEKMKATNKIIRNKKLAEIEKVDELMALGFNEQQALKLFEPDFCGRIGFADYALKNNLAKIKDAEVLLKRHADMANKEDKAIDYIWGTLRYDYSDERYRFIFNERPPREVIDMMKESGFKWSPSNSAWQRQITPNASYTTGRLLVKLNEYYKKTA